MVPHHTAPPPPTTPYPAPDAYPAPDPCPTAGADGQGTVALAVSVQGSR
jgi:hypothetical protein